MDVKGNTPKKKVKIDLCEENMQTTKAVMVDLGNCNESNKESSPQKPGNYLKFDYENTPIRMDVKAIVNKLKEKSKVDVCEQNTPTSTQVSKSNETDKLMAKQSILAILNFHRNIFANYIKNKDKSSRPTKLPNFLYFDNENIGNSPKRKRKLDISEKNTPTAKKMMANFSKSSKESSLVKPGNDLGLKYDLQKLSPAPSLARPVSELEKIVKVTAPEELQRTPGKQTMIKQTRLGIGTTRGQSPIHHPVLTLLNKGNTSTPCSLSSSPGPSFQNNSTVASMGTGGNSSVNMAVPCTLASLPVDMHEKAYQHLQQTTHLQGQVASKSNITSTRNFDGNLLTYIK